MNSERTRLCGTALDMLTSVANGLGHDFDQLMPLFMPTLLNVCGRTNKVVINRARGVILSIIESTQLASILSFFVQNIKDKAATLRLVVAEGTLACLNSCNPPDLEKEARARDIEAIIRGSARDANPEVRKVSRKIFESYKLLLPSRVERYVDWSCRNSSIVLIFHFSFTAPLSPTMKKYLDIKPTTTAKSQSLISSKSTSNLRVNSEVPEVNPVTIKAHGHMRTASASTIAVTNAVQSKNLAAKLTRVVRKEQPGPRIQPSTTESITVSGCQNARPASSSSTAAGAASGPIRTISHNTQSNSAAVPSRNATSRLTSTIAITTSANAITVAPRRLQVTSDTKTSAAAQHPPTTCGARRVPIPPPAPHKEQESHKRPPSRVESSASTNDAVKASSTNLARPTVPIKKPATIAVRKPTTKPPIPKFRPTGNANSTGTAPAPSIRTDDATKPLVINKAKPIWGRAAAPPTKAAPSASQKAPAKSVVKKPSSLISKTVTTITTQSSASTKRPVTPAMVALPPSPAGCELKDDHDEQKEDDEKCSKVAVKEVVLQAGDTLPKLSTSHQAEPNIIAEDEDEDADRTIQHETRTHTSVSVSPADSPLSTPTSEGSGPVCNAEKPSIHNSDLLGDDQAMPHTPESNLLLKAHDSSTPLFSAKTPISALLSSIERGFFYSPTTPLSPADAYLPGPNGTIAYRHETHAPRVEGPMRPFNHALHAMNPGETIFEKIGAMREADGANIALTG